MVYDISKRTSFDNLTRWMVEVTDSVAPDLPILVVGNKCDLQFERCIDTREGEQYAQKLNKLFIETSAKTSHNVDSAFEMFDLLFFFNTEYFYRLARQIKRYLETRQLEKSNDSVNLTTDQEAKSGCCG